MQGSRLDLADQSQFWCGFCSRDVKLRNSGAAALDERFNHIDAEHFKKGERGRDWCLLSLGGTGGGEVGSKSPLQTAERSNGRKRKYSGE